MCVSFSQVQCDDIQHQIQLSNKNQRKLEKQIKKLKSERRGPLKVHSPAAALDSLSSALSHSEEATHYSPMLKSFMASLPLPEGMQLTVNIILLSATNTQYTHVYASSFGLWELCCTPIRKAEMQQSGTTYHSPGTRVHSSKLLN